MPYQSVSSCRFYINVLEFLAESGALSITEQYRTLPVKPMDVAVGSFNYGGEYLSAFVGGGEPRSFIAILGHNFGRNNEGDGFTRIILAQAGNISPVINFDVSWVGGPYELNVKNGFSIATTGGGGGEGFENANNAGSLEIAGEPHHPKAGSIILGTYFDLQAPNLSLTMSREYGGTKEITSHNGSSFSNTMWDRQPLWGDLGAWELFNPVEIEGIASTQCILLDVDGNVINPGNWSGTWNEAFYYSQPGIEDLFGTFEEFCTSGMYQSFPAGTDSTYVQYAEEGSQASVSINPALSRSGRRVWQLNFSYMDQAGLWGPLQALDNIAFSKVMGGFVNGGSALTDLGWDSDDVNDFDTLESNLLNDDSFYSQVWHKSLNGTLPFIFQPDTNDTTNYAIARFRNNSLKATQTAPGAYDISVIIEEVF